MGEMSVIGSWKLIASYLYVGEHEEATRVALPDEMVGLLMVNESYMSVQFMMPLEFDLKSTGLSKMLIKKIYNLYSNVINFPIQGFGGYFGPYHLDEENNRVFVNVEGSVYRHLVGNEEVRYYEFLDEVGQILRIHPEPQNILGKMIRLYFEFEKIEENSVPLTEM